MLSSLLPPENHNDRQHHVRANMAALAAGQRNNLNQALVAAGLPWKAGRYPEQAGVSSGVTLVTLWTVSGVCWCRIPVGSGRALDSALAEAMGVGPSWAGDCACLVGRVPPSVAASPRQPPSVAWAAVPSL